MAKKDVQMPFRVTAKIADGLEKAAAASDMKPPDLLREAAAAIVRAHQRTRSGRVPKDMEIRPRIYPEAEDVNWEVAEAPPGETLNSVMRQTPREAAAFFAGRLRGEIMIHPHYVHERGRALFLEILREELIRELGEIIEASSQSPATAKARVRRGAAAGDADPVTKAEVKAFLQDPPGK